MTPRKPGRPQLHPDDTRLRRLYIVATDDEWDALLSALPADARKRALYMLNAVTGVTTQEDKDDEHFDSEIIVSRDWVEELRQKAQETNKRTAQLDATITLFEATRRQRDELLQALRLLVADMDRYLYPDEAMDTYTTKHEGKLRELLAKYDAVTGVTTQEDSDE